MASNPFRILSLSGGGTRGIFQAVFLKELEKELRTPLWQHFDLIAGTSTGAIIALAVALDIEISKIVELYRNKSEYIFKPKLFYGFRKGPRYKQKVLRRYLGDVFGDKKLSDTKTKVLVTATCLDQFSHRVFSSFPTSAPADNNLSAVDVVLSSSAAPTYFAPMKPSSQERSYVDGGLWANSPSLVAVLLANRYLDIHIESMRLLSIGTGDFQRGLLHENLCSSRTYSPSTIRNMFEIMFSAQENASDEYTRELLGTNNFIRISTQLDEPILLDNVEKAIKKLPALAEKQTATKLNEVVTLLTTQSSSPVRRKHKLLSKNVQGGLISDELIEATGLTAFYPSRRYYVYRKGTERIDAYVSTAKKSLIMISINLMTGLPFTALCQILQDKLENVTNSFVATISLLNPFKADLIFAISPVLNRTKEQLFDSITDTLKQLVEFRSMLSSEAKNRFKIRVHNTIPFGSAIIIDHHEEYGRIQIETKPYGAVLDDSFAFEVAPFGTSGFYQTLVKGYEALIKDGNSIEEIGFNSTST